MTDNGVAKKNMLPWGAEACMPDMLGLGEVRPSSLLCAFTKEQFLGTQKPVYSCLQSSVHGKRCLNVSEPVEKKAHNPDARVALKCATFFSPHCC